jgi:hypothetical protein
MLGLNFVRERIMRRHYGFAVRNLFIEGYHPGNLKVKGLDGLWRCDNIMEWYARRV